MSDIKKKFRDIFGESSEHKNESDVTEKIEDVSEESKKVSVEDDDKSESTDNEIADEYVQSDIEKDAKEYFTNNHQSIVDERIKSIRENALNTYAKDDDNTQIEDTDSSDFDFADDLQEVDNIFDENSEQSEEIHEEEGGVFSEADDEISDKPQGDVTESAVSYDMTQLLKILKKDSEADFEDDEDEIIDSKSRKKKKKSDLTDETDIPDKFSNLEDEPNEYHHDFEYNDEVQSKDMFKSFRKSALVASISVVLTLVFSLLCLWIECGHAAGLPFANMMRAEYYGNVYAMVSLQMLAFCIMFNLDGFARGVKKLSLRKSSPESIAVIAVGICVLHTVYTAFAANNSIEYKTFCFVGCFITFLLSFNTFVKAFTRFKAFCMVLSKKPKLTTVKLDTLSEENSVFAKYLSEDSDVLAVSKTEGISEFVKKNYTIPKAVSGCNVLVYLVIALSVLTACGKLIALKASLYAAITSGVTVFMFSAPITILLAVAVPYFVTSVRVSKLHNSILGEAACDYYENAGVLSFDDTEVFPAKSVKVTSIKTYNDYRIDKVIICMAKTFEKLGGPLSHVFASSVQDGVGSIDDVLVLESSKDGVHLTVDGEDVLVGTGNYLRMFDIEAPVDDADESETRALTSIIYLVCSGQLAAKFYIKYMPNRRFEDILKGMYDAGICCGVRTCSPGVDNRLVEANLKEANYPVSVIHKPIKDIGRVEEKSNGALVGVSNIHNFLRSFIMLDMLRSTYRTNTVFAILATIIGLAVSIILEVVGFSIGTGSILLFNVLWAIPMVLVSIFRK